MTITKYRLEIMSAQEAASRLGVMAAELEELLERAPEGLPTLDAGSAAYRATIALDILALRKAQVALEEVVKSQWANVTREDTPYDLSVPGRGLRELKR